jgi:putative ABC transport system ATP-binding protein
MSSAPDKLPVPLMEMRNVTVSTLRDASVTVAEGVNWKVAPGDFWVIGGLQGAGKSDFIVTAGGLMPPVSGEYYFNGERMPIFEEERLEQRLRLGIVFDGGRLLHHLTVSENVSLPIRYHRNLASAEADLETRELMTLCELDPWRDSTPGALAGAWQKRAGLARALVLKPEVLLLDNPLAGLDLRHRTWWLQFLGHLARGHPWFNERPVTLIVTADDLRPWEHLARQFAVLKKKQFQAMGSWDQLRGVTDNIVRELMMTGTGNE